jgi:glycine cleavage system H lipoate-binding protein
MQGATGDIFATKGLEYLIVIGYLLLLMGVWRLLSPPKLARALGMRSPRKPVASHQWFALPDGVFYHQGHGWAAPTEGDTVRVGMDDFAQRLVGTPDAIALPHVGERLEQGVEGWALQFGAERIAMVSPVNGEVVSVNPALGDSLDMVNADPYGRGWLCEVRVSSPRAAFKNLLSGDLARSWMHQVVERLRQMPTASLGVVMPDGGVPVSGFARVIAPDDWTNVARDLLLSS